MRAYAPSVSQVQSAVHLGEAVFEAEDPRESRRLLHRKRSVLQEAARLTNTVRELKGAGLRASLGRCSGVFTLCELLLRCFIFVFLRLTILTCCYR